MGSTVSHKNSLVVIFLDFTNLSDIILVVITTRIIHNIFVLLLYKTLESTASHTVITMQTKSNLDLSIE